MLKIYHGPSAYYDSVHYAGDLNEDGTEISGTWRVAANWSGTFLMVRSRTVETAATRRLSNALARRDQCVMKTGTLAASIMWLVTPPSTRCLSRLWV